MEAVYQQTQPQLGQRIWLLELYERFS